MNLEFFTVFRAIRHEIISGDREMNTFEVERRDVRIRNVALLVSWENAVFTLISMITYAR